MVVLVFGAILIAVGAISISFPELCASLKNNDAEKWKQLGSPLGYAFTDLGSTLGVFSWVLGREFESSSSAETVAAGTKAYTKARFAKYCLLVGVTFVFIGFGLSIAGM
ncbi:hypothetical protein F6455_11205 [Proteobacteria bacterium 005FR1]|nr:hypothetical protein [Proteobacteria bacterium 005FR1]